MEKRVLFKRIVILLVTLLVFGIGSAPVAADKWIETGESIFVEYNLVRYDDTTESVYYIIHNSYSCSIVLDVHALSISNASRNVYAVGRMESGKFQFYNDTCVIERKSFRFDTDSLKAIFELSGELIIISYGKGKATHYKFSELDKTKMLELFNREPDRYKDPKTTL